MKIRVLVLATAVFAGALAAQQPATPPVNPITTAFKGRILGAARNIAQAFDSIPESKFSYKPTPAQLSFGYIAQHVTSDNYLFCGRFGGAPPSGIEADAATPDSVKAKWPKADLVTKLKASFAYCAASLDQVTDANIGEAVSFTMNGTARSTTRVNMVLGHALDLADHYSQIANYMRLNNLIPPSALPRPGRGN